MKQSAKFSLNLADYKAQAKSALVFLGPSVLAMLAVLTPAVDQIVPDNNQKLFLLIAVKYVLDQLTGLLRRFLAGK